MTFDPTHQIHGNDDTACRFLAMSAGQRTRHDNEQISLALQNLPYSNGAIPRASFPIDPSNVWLMVL